MSNPQRADARREWAVAGFAVLALLVLVFPMPTVALDGLLSLQLAGSLAIFLTALRAPRPLKLSSFPTVLLLTTLFRLALNVSTTRAILSSADAGHVVAAFGDTVIAGNLLVGAVVFGVLTIVQYLVVAKGAERVAQVTARFALDGLPGRQLAIDGELRAGQINAETARARRASLDRLSTLHGAMDGAMKFVRGDAIAGLCIVGVNAVGGLIVGVVQQGMSLDEALHVYTALTIGDGLLAQLPALLTASAAALLVTRVGGDGRANPATVLLSELASDGRPLLLSGAGVAALGLLPGMPLLPLGLAGLALGGVGLARALSDIGSTPPSEHRPRVPELAPSVVRLHPALLEALPDCRHLINRARERALLEYGLPIPPTPVHSGPELPDGTLQVELAEATVARHTVRPGLIFSRLQRDDATSARDPDSGVTGAWVTEGAGLTAAEFFCACLVAAWRRNASSLMGLQTVADRVGQVESTRPALTRAVIPRRVDLPRLTRLLQRCLEDDLPTRDLPAILEALAAMPEGLDEDAQYAALRRGLAPVITQRVARSGWVDALYPSTELVDALRAGPLDYAASEALLDDLEERLVRKPSAVLLAPPDLRERAVSAIRHRLPGLPVITVEEVLPQTRIVTVGLLDL